MAVSGKLLVERGSYGAPSQDWGEFKFLGLPSPGDRIEAQYDGGTHYLTILCVHHRPVAVAATESASDMPRAEIVAKWTGKRD
ncbi:hypothetical protein G7A66_01105 [Altererythrobacter sp. SALINAS58]|uniref:hypothetical protein n=1 Tax=Alteripontixanthobacter muriae TaxID=2705546 RepID=UPI001576D758|nr:hypothetical protein [Alteripontixanthobacter muriae]NTZ41705.1 hypothetical protein [Alteripontixanthobacter muriae]